MRWAVMHRTLPYHENEIYTMPHAKNENLVAGPICGRTIKIADLLHAVKVAAIVAFEQTRTNTAYIHQENTFFSSCYKMNQ